MKKSIMQYVYANESISFQSGELFKDLINGIAGIKKFGVELKDDDYFNTPELQAIYKIIEKHTNLDVWFGNSKFASSRVCLDNSKSILVSNIQKLNNAISRSLDPHMDAKFALDGFSRDVIGGHVDINNSKVYGAFEYVQSMIFVPREALYGDTLFDTDEISAIILHELGHIFTAMEFISRVVRTNQVLAGLTRTLDDTVAQDAKKVIIARSAKILNMSHEAQEAISSTKDGKTVTCIVLDAAIKLCESELGGSVYDSTSCEQLADQFATRHGAGRALVTALDKFNRWGSAGIYSPTSYIKPFIYFATVGLGFVSIPLFAGVFLVLLAIETTSIYRKAQTYYKEDSKYDNDFSRFMRVKLQNIEQLKNLKISKELKQMLISDNEIIDSTMKLYKDNLSFIEKVAYYLKPSYRNAHKYELLEKDLELISSSSLFEASSKLSLI